MRRGCPGNLGQPSLTYWCLRDGAKTRIVKRGSFVLYLCGLALGVSNTIAGIIVNPKPRELLITTSGAELILKGKSHVKVEEGRYMGDRWAVGKPLPTRRDGHTTAIEMGNPAVVIVMY